MSHQIHKYGQMCIILFREIIWLLGSKWESMITVNSKRNSLGKKIQYFLRWVSHPGKRVSSIGHWSHLQDRKCQRTQFSFRHGYALCFPFCRRVSDYQLGLGFHLSSFICEWPVSFHPVTSSSIYLFFALGMFNFSVEDTLWGPT